MSVDKTVLICPVCKELIENKEQARTYKCINNHCYDLAKQGYLNLLMSNQKKSNHPGESKEMITIRREFLDKGYYKPVSDQVNIMTSEYLDKQNGTVLDLGCGEGYYLNQMEQYFLEKNKDINFYGLDISKEAVRLASIRNKSIKYVVSSNFAPPFKDNSIDILLSVFSPISDEECDRLIGENGCFVRVLPNPDHLIELREIIYDHLEERRDGNIPSEKLTCVKEAKVTYKIDLEQDDLMKLLQMTPHYWKTSAKNKERILEVEMLSVTIDMNVSVYRR